ncbi:MAG: mechanosensitive ion channel domain-containing protein [Thermoanaerobaculia bacterium]
MEDSLKAWLYDPTVGRVVAALIGVLIVIGLVRFAQRTLGRYVQDTDVRYRARKFVSFVGYAVGILVIATVFSDRLGGLTVAFGVAGAGVAFALQEVIASVAGWFAISFAGYYKPGHRVQLGGIRGDVIDIGILRTTLMECGEWVKGDQYNGRVVRVANSFVFKEPVFNYSGEFPFLWDEITVPVKYGCDHHLARELLLRVAGEVVGPNAASAKGAWQQLVQRYLIEDAKVDPLVTMVANDNWMEFTLRYVVDFKRRRATKDELFSRILDEIAASDGGVALASATFQIVETPVLDVRLKGGTESRVQP